MNRQNISRLFLLSRPTIHFCPQLWTLFFSSSLISVFLIAYKAFTMYVNITGCTCANRFQCRKNTKSYADLLTILLAETGDVYVLWKRRVRRHIVKSHLSQMPYVKIGHQSTQHCYDVNLVKRKSSDAKLHIMYM